MLFDPFASPYAVASNRASDEDRASAGTAVMPARTAMATPTDFRAAVGTFERELLEHALERAQFKQTTAAELLGLSYHQLRGLLKKHSLPARENEP
jgi:psp operon transcriptional activator